MIDEPKGVTKDAGETSEPTTPVDEPKTPEEPEVPKGKAEPTGEAEPEEPKGETGEGSKKGANARIRELNAAKNAAEDKAKSLEERLAELTQVGSQVPQAPYQPQIEPGVEYSTDQFKNEVMRSAISAAQLITKQSESGNRINNEAQQVLRLYPELDPESDSFDKELSESVTEATLAYVKSEPYTASPKKFVDKMMKPYRRAVTKEVGKASENIARQVSQAAQRPTSVSTGGKKSDNELSIKELEDKYGIVQT